MGILLTHYARSHTKFLTVPVVKPRHPKVSAIELRTSEHGADEIKRPSKICIFKICQVKFRTVKSCFD